MISTMGAFLGRMVSASSSSAGYCSRILVRMPRWTEDLVRLLPTTSSAGTNLVGQAAHEGKRVA